MLMLSLISRSGRTTRSTIRRIYTTTTLPKTPVSTSRPRVTKLGRGLAYTSLAFGTGYVVDRYYNASAIARNARTLYTCLAITADYKINFTPEKNDKIPELHERVAQRIYDLLTSNGGLYIKIGQAIGANAAVLPKPMQLKFASLFDDAPQVPYADILDVFIKELGRPPSGPNGVFEIFDEQAIASASIAQVHKAKLWGKDEWVAVKVQKPAVRKQVEWDLGAYRMVMWMMENWAFDLPVYFIVDFVADHLRQELDFEREAWNAGKTAAFVESEPSLKGKVYIPKVYPEYTTTRVMTAEWIEGVRLSDKQGVKRLVGEEEQDLDLDVTSSLPSTSPNTLPASRFNFPKEPLKGGTKAIMQTMVELFSAQMFQWGWVHCDPHPGNVVIRPNPSNPKYPQLVLLDHGLYVEVPEKFRKEWVKLWRGMLSGDFSEVDNVTREWGIRGPDLMASFTLMKPVVLERNRKQKSKEELEKVEQKKELTQYEMSVKMKKKLREFLEDTDRMPKVLIFLTRNMRMVQGNNQSLGSPVNRIKITGYWASRSLINDRRLEVGERFKEWCRHLVFRAVMLTLDLAFWRVQFLSWLTDLQFKLRALIPFGDGTKKSRRRRRRKNFEDELETSMRQLAKEGFGIEMGEGVFVG